MPMAFFRLDEWQSQKAFWGWTLLLSLLPWGITSILGTLFRAQDGIDYALFFISIGVFFLCISLLGFIVSSKISKILIALGIFLFTSFYFSVLHVWLFGKPTAFQIEANVHKFLFDVFSYVLASFLAGSFVRVVKDRRFFESTYFWKLILANLILVLVVFLPTFFDKASSIDYQNRVAICITQKSSDCFAEEISKLPPYEWSNSQYCDREARSAGVYDICLEGFIVFQENWIQKQRDAQNGMAYSERFDRTPIPINPQYTALGNCGGERTPEIERTACYQRVLPKILHPEKSCQLLGMGDPYFENFWKPERARCLKVYEEIMGIKTSKPTAPEKGLNNVVPNSQASPCTDSDGGNNIYVKGTTTGEVRCAGPCSPRRVATDTDLCLDGTRLNEWYCDPDDGYPTIQGNTCPNGCRDGACVK